ncbi:hypothetical protein Avbf_18876 [Armadillidium vulgare]|nr:hypothetical protein Avbf_18876 [Armadillidium vulgare]
MFCESMTGNLTILDDIDDYFLLFFLQKYMSRKRKNKQCEDNERKLMPRFTGDAETCLSILEENFYYFSDEWCTIKLSPLCMTNKI